MEIIAWVWSFLPTTGCNRYYEHDILEGNIQTSKFIAFPGFTLGRYTSTGTFHTVPSPPGCRSNFKIYRWPVPWKVQKCMGSITWAIQLHTWRLRAKVNTAQETQHNPKPARRRILLPRDSTIKTWKRQKRVRNQTPGAQHFLFQQNLLR